MKLSLTALRVCIFCLFFSLTSMSQQFAQAQFIIAHRGASHDAPENTLAAFRLAWAQKADGIEGDFYLSKDGRVVCIHDKTTKRTAGVKLDVAKSTLAELQKLDVGRWKDKQFSGERIPTLEDVIATVPEGKRIVIELKVGAEIVAPMARILKASKLQPEQILVISFDEKTIAESKRLLPQIKAHWLTGYDPEGDKGPWTPTAASIVKTISRTNADGLGSQARRSILTAKFIRALNAAGINEFHVFTVDDPVDARYYQSLGAFGITTNRPAFIRSELNKNSP
jgi:glycerophosphoryl diester phosphodiesterase